MTQFVQIHFLTSYPPSNLNRDDSGSPKTAFMGGANRLRISSQSLKRAWRISSVFESALSGYLGTRTKRIGIDIYEKFIAKGIEEKQAREWARQIAGQFGALKKAEKKQKAKEDNTQEKNELTAREKNADLEIEQLAHFSPEELAAIDQLIEECVVNKSAPSKEALQLLRKNIKAADIACFGRMLADYAEHNMEAAVQVAHAITTHAVDIEDDYFTAVDDLNKGVEDSGAAHLGETSFGAGLFYGYVCIDRDLLKKNLANDEELTQKTIASLLECVATVAPTGKQNSFASRAYTSYMVAEKGTQQPRSLAVAFLKPTKENDLLNKSISDFELHRNNINKVFGACYHTDKKFNTTSGEGTLAELIAFAKTEL